MVFAALPKLSRSSRRSGISKLVVASLAGDVQVERPSTGTIMDSAYPWLDGNARCVPGAKYETGARGTDEPDPRATINTPRTGNTAEDGVSAVAGKTCGRG